MCARLRAKPALGKRKTSLVVVSFGAATGFDPNADRKVRPPASARFPRRLIASSTRPDKTSCGSASTTTERNRAFATTTAPRSPQRRQVHHAVRPDGSHLLPLRIGNPAETRARPTRYGARKGRDELVAPLGTDRTRSTGFPAIGDSPGGSESARTRQVPPWASTADIRVSPVIGSTVAQPSRNERHAPHLPRVIKMTRES